MWGKNKKKNEIDIYKNRPTVMDLIVPDELQEKSNHLELGYNKYSREFVMTVYPEQTWVGWLNDLFYIGNINISIKIEPSNNGTVINQLSKKYVQSQSEYATYSRQGNVLHLPELEKQLIDLDELRKIIQTNEDKLFFVTISITLNTESLEELNEKTKILESELSKKSAMLRILTFRQLEGLKTTLPIGEVPIPNFERNMVAGGVATLIPISNPNLSHDRGIFIGRNIHTNSPVCIDTFIGPPLLPNPHVFICGTSGGGKSVALKILTVRNIAATGTGAFFIDVEGEYTDLVNALGGKVIKISQGQSSGINPFDIEPDIKENKEFLNILDKIAEIRTLMATICRNYQYRTLDGAEMGEIEIVVNELYSERGITSDVNSLYEKKGGKLQNGKYVVGNIPKKMPTLTDFYNKLVKRSKCNKLAELLIPFLKGNSLRNI